MSRTPEEIANEDARRMTARMNAVRHMEPEALAALEAGYASGHDAAKLSSAISLKRIADALEKMNEPFNEYGETPIEAIGAGITRALRQHQ